MEFFTFRPAANITKVIGTYTTASQLGAAPGAGSGPLQISDEERRHILEEEQRQLDNLKVNSFI